MQKTVNRKIQAKQDKETKNKNMKKEAKQKKPLNLSWKMLKRRKKSSKMTALSIEKKIKTFFFKTFLLFYVGKSPVAVH